MHNNQKRNLGDASVGANLGHGLGSVQAGGTADSTSHFHCCGEEWQVQKECVSVF